MSEKWGLVPKEMVSAYYQLNKPEHRTEDNIQELIQKNDMPDDLKAKLLGQLITKYHKLMKPEPEKKFEIPPELLQSIEPSETEIPDLPPVPFAIAKYLGHAVPKTRKKYVLPILEKLKDIGVTFNDRNELVVDGKPVFRSNVVDLISHIMRDTQKPGVPPRGFDQFFRAIYEINIPTQWIGNRWIREQMSIVDADPKMSAPSPTLSESGVIKPSPSSTPTYSKKRTIRWVPWETP